MKEVIRVIQISKEVMKEACKISLQTELQKLNKLDGKIVYQSLSKEQIYQLAQKIIFLPFEYRNLLFFRHCFESTVFEIEKILEIENAENKLRYVQRMLSRLMELNNSTWIDNTSIKDACILALQQDMNFYESTEVLYKPKYSHSFRRKLRKIKAAQSPFEIFRLIVKRVAVFVVVCILSFSAVLAINVEAREKFYNWVIETLPKFSIFITQNKDENSNFAELNAFKIKYIPSGFELNDTTEFRTMMIYDYLSKDGKKLTIKLFASNSEDKTYYDTENIKVKEFIFKGFQAYTWQTDQITYLIWHQDGIECHVWGNISQDEIEKVAENIEK